MRRKIIAGNWKMNNNLKLTVELISEIINKMDNHLENTDVIVCPPFTSLETAVELTKNSKVRVGAQNMFYEKNGAFTGEVSAEMIKNIGCEYVILGHSERRTIFGESNEWINKKIKKALEESLKPIFCIGETLEERQNGTMEQVLKTQVFEGLSGVTESQMANIIVAYEPVWAIGTGVTASPEQADEAHKFIRDLVEKLFNSSVAQELIIQYGGSMKPENAKELLSKPNIDGGLIGGASLKADTFLSIINASN